MMIKAGEPFRKDDIKVRDHDHATGKKYRGAAHCKCNIKYFSNRYVPVVFHNLKGYDGHQIIREAYNLYPDKDLSVIPNSYEKFMSFKLGQLKFIDSFQFMSSSLEKLVENLYIIIICLMNLNIIMMIIINLILIL